MIRSASPRQRKCKVCEKPFTPFSSTAKVCGVACAVELSKQIKAKKAAKELAAQKQELKPLSYWAGRAQKACNAYIRERDKGDPCISCGTYDAPEWHAGHLYTVKARPDIRFHEDNIHLQCPSCNTYQGGMVGEYRKRVVSKIGRERLYALAYVNPAAKKTREYYQAVEVEYKQKLKQLQGVK